MRGFEYIAKTWLAYGVRDIFLVPTNLFDALVALEGSGVRRIMTHGEKAAAYMADGYARATGRPGIVITQGGPGAANLAAGLAEPWQSSTPVIAFTGALSARQTNKNAYQDVTSHFESVTKYNVEAGRTDRLPDILAQAFREATSGDPGPVHVAVQAGAEMGDAPLAEPVVDQRYAAAPAFRIEPSAEDVAAAVRLLLAAERPIIAGGGAMTSGAWPELNELAERLSIPVATTLSGKGCIAENHPLAIGVPGTYGRGCANRLVARADLALIVGTRTSGQSTNGWTLPRPETDIIHININPSELGRNFPHSTKVGLAADARTALRRLNEALAGQTREPGEWVAEVQRTVREWQAAKEPALSADDAPIRPERLCRELSEALPPDGLIVCDTGYSSGWAGAFVELRTTGRRFIRCEGSLGWALPASIGVKAALPDRPVVCFSGDGGFWYHIGELETAVRYGLNVVFVVLNNSTLAFDAHLLDFYYAGRAPDLANFSAVDFARIGEAMGCRGISVQHPGELAGAFKAAFASDRPVVINVATAREAVAPVTNYARGGDRDRMVLDQAGEVVSSRGTTPAGTTASG